MFDRSLPALTLYNLIRPEILADPYPLYCQLRSSDPVHWDSNLGSWVLTRYADVVACLLDPRLSARRIYGSPETQDPITRALSQEMLFLDPPDHTRLRKLVTRSFTPRMVEGMRPRIQQIVDQLLDAAGSSGGMDAIRDLAGPLPVVVIAEMLGVPVTDRDALKRWSDDFAALLGTLSLDEEQMAKARQSAMEMIDYFQGVVRQRRGGPGDDLISALIAAEEQGDALSAGEVVMNAMLLLAAGHETTTNLIGNGLLALLRHPEQQRRLMDEPSLIVSAVEELLRYDSPVQFTDRIAREPLEIGGLGIEPGQTVTVVLAAANRDPAQFPEPDRLDLGRRDNRHVAFGQGIHFCVGAALARLEGQIAIQTVLSRFPALRLESNRLHWRTNQVVRGLKSLPVLC
jgi:cytochrome P450